MVATDERPVRAPALAESNAAARRKPATARSKHPDQPRSITLNATGSIDAPRPNPALMSALTTDHYASPSSRTSTIVEANGRSIPFLSSVSGATVTLAFVAQLDRMGDTFVTLALTVQSALLALGLTSYSRLADLAVTTRPAPAPSDASGRST
jgi:hypothetical protein